MIVDKIFKYILFPDYRFCVNASHGSYNGLPDDEYLLRKFSAIVGSNLSLNVPPTTFNEKLQYLKLYDRRPEYTVMVDKYKARGYIAEKIGEQYLIPLIGVWNDPDEIDFAELPNQFVMKCNHNSGLGMCICKDKAQLNIPKVKKELRKGLKQDYYLTGREWPYKDVPRKIIAEQFLQSDAGGLTDYKIHCFNGVPKFILVCKDRFTESGLTEDFYTTDWEHMAVKRPKIPNAVAPSAKPEKLDEMLSLAAKLSENIPFLRVDFYIVDNKIYFSELTFFPASGFEKYEPEEWDKIFGDWLVLPHNTRQTN